MSDPIIRLEPRTYGCITLNRSITAKGERKLAEIISRNKLEPDILETCEAESIRFFLEKIPVSGPGTLNINYFSSGAYDTIVQKMKLGFIDDLVLDCNLFIQGLSELMENIDHPRIAALLLRADSVFLGSASRLLSSGDGHYEPSAKTAHVNLNVQPATREYEVDFKFIVKYATVHELLHMHQEEAFPNLTDELDYYNGDSTFQRVKKEWSLLESGPTFSTYLLFAEKFGQQDADRIFQYPKRSIYAIGLGFMKAAHKEFGKEAWAMTKAMPPETLMEMKEPGRYIERVSSEFRQQS